MGGPQSGPQPAAVCLSFPLGQLCVGAQPSLPKASEGELHCVGTPIPLGPQNLHAPHHLLGMVSFTRSFKMSTKLSPVPEQIPWGRAT